MKNEILKPVNKQSEVEIDKESDPQSYFKDRKGLYVWDSFSERILAKAESVKKGTKYTLDSFKLEKYSTDEEIEAALPKKHVFTESEVCAIIANLIDQQPEGKDGVLDSKNYNYNLFYTPNFVVSVLWSANGRRWSVIAWLRGGNDWGGGLRVFSPAD